jgi:phosphoribosyl 1,2-cyclic phosphodiesterase
VVSHDLVKDYVEHRRKQSHGRFDKFVQAIEHLAARRLIVAGLQEKNHGDYEGELKQRESHYAPYRSREQFDQAMVAPVY